MIKELISQAYDELDKECNGNEYCNPCDRCKYNKPFDINYERTLFKIGVDNKFTICETIHDLYYKYNNFK